MRSSLGGFVLGEFAPLVPVVMGVVSPSSPPCRALASLLCSWLDGYPQDFMGLEPRLREQLVSWLHWAWGSRPGPEKSLPDVPSSRDSLAVERGGEEGPGQDGDPDPHYILGLQAEEVAAHLTAQDGVSAEGRAEACTLLFRLWHLSVLPWPQSRGEEKAFGERPPTGSGL